ncbi:histidine phosphatase family protein [Acidisoma sp.]|uniref:histidine phosphatase family protein n=1 Tax=Acidisoma sp. TaxID=1872115 RepID=UPI003B001D51
MPVETTRFWLIRHALVDPEARKFLYGTQDVGICEDTMAAQTDAYAALGRRLPRPAVWLVTPLSRTLRTAQAIFAAGYPEAPLTVEPDLIEQSFGSLQGTPGARLAERLRLPAHDFWPTSHAERPEDGESFDDVILRVGSAMERLSDTYEGEDVVVVCHGGVIRAAVAHVLQLGGEQALRLTVGNISLTRIERRGASWRVVSANETVEGVPAF